MLYTAEKQPAVFFATCARLLPNDVRVTVEQSTVSAAGLSLPTTGGSSTVLEAYKAGSVQFGLA